MAIFSEFTIEKCTRTPAQRTELDKIMRPILFTQHLLGQQVLDSDWSWLKYAHIHIIAACIVVYVTFGTLEVIQTTNASLRAEGFYTFMIIIGLVLKFFLSITNRDNFREMYLTAKTKFFSFIKEVSEETSAFVLKRAQFIVRMLFGVIVFPVSFYFLTAMFYYVKGTRVTLSKSTSTLMPMTSPYYEIGLVLHAIFMTYASFVVLIVDMWFVYMMFFFCVASDCLSKTLCVPRENGDTDETYATKLDAALRRFYVHHVQQVRYFNILIKMFKWMAVIPLCHVLICMCLMLLIVSQEFNWAFVSFASNILPTFAELFAYNWYGEQVKTRANNLSMALLDFDWTCMRPKDKKKFHIIVTYMKREFGMKTAFGNELSLVTMTSVLKGSYQVFAAMKSIEN
ncbi:uncharacterized protein LOC115440695 [Manduca sexta]|uniref:uncharacterized protein LOC115440695 n=1 Tax=Manduca sexta TaxID=7130 RepID=UPI001184583D|nr:uncharacterized protein LOC115440695 [Manduca sexta]